MSAKWIPSELNHADEVSGLGDSSSPSKLLIDSIQAKWEGDRGKGGKQKTSTSNNIVSSSSDGKYMKRAAAQHTELLGSAGERHGKEDSVLILWLFGCCVFFGYLFYCCYCYCCCCYCCCCCCSYSYCCCCYCYVFVVVVVVVV